MINCCPRKLPADSQGIDPALIQTGEWSWCQACWGYVHKQSWDLHWQVVHGYSSAEAIRRPPR